MSDKLTKSIGFGFMIAGVFVTSGLAQQKLYNSKNKPNIVIFLSDDHSIGDMGSMGNKDVSTPVMDQLASEGMSFTRVFATTPICAPSRSAMYTSLYPHRNGCHQQSGKIKNGIKTFPDYFREQGYRVALAGKVHVGPRTSFPFEYIKRQELSAFMESARQEPFCLIIAYNNPHEPYFNKKDGVPFQNIKPKAWMPNTSETLMLTAAYYDNVENLDHEIGASLYWLEKMGMPENTIQIYTSDHGSGLPYAKWSLYEEGLHVPLIIKWDGVIEPGTNSDALISLIDLLPTLLEMTGSPIPEDIDGKSFMPVISGEMDEHNKFIYTAYTNLGVNEGNRYPIRSIRNDRFKLIINVNYREPFSIRITTLPDERSVICGYRVLESWKNAGDNDSFAKERYHNFHFRPRLELYDLKNDPHELKNLAGQEKYKEVQQTLFSEIKKWIREQGDPIYYEII